ncbi:MAG: hypothetical protein RIM83_16155 [Allomuricauda sp.]
MRVLAVILSLLTILLSSYPCCQETGSCSETSAVDQCGHDDPEEVPHGTDAPCSPFYNCGRCPGFTVTHETLNFVCLELEKETPPITYVELLPKEVYFFSLKPPRIFEV